VASCFRNPVSVDAEDVSRLQSSCADGRFPRGKQTEHCGRRIEPFYRTPIAE